MLLSLRFLNDVKDENSFEFAESPTINAGSAQDLYFQLVDRSKDTPEQGFVPGYRRYMPADDATVTVTFGHIDDTRKITRLASQPHPKDPSIWSVSILSTDGLKGTVPVKIVLNESGATKTAQLLPGMLLRAV
jgi:hypothetical protein